MPPPSTTHPPLNSTHFETWRLFDPFYLCCYCIPVTIHYSLVLLIIRKVKANSGYFLIFYLMGLSDVVYCCSMLSSEFTHYTQLIPKVAFVIFVVISYYGVFFNHFANILLSMNRFCATCVWYNTYFDHTSIKKYFIAITIASFICTLPGGILMVYFLYMDWGTEAQYLKTGIFSFNTHRTIIIALTISDTLIGILASLATVYRLKKYKFNYDKSRVFLIFLVSFNSLAIVCTNRKIRRQYFQILIFCKDWDAVGNSFLGKKSSTPGLDRVTVF